MNLNEDIYSQSVRAFIRFSKKTEKLPANKRLGYLKDFCDENFKKLGEGQFRAAYITGNQEIIKIVKSSLPNKGHFDNQPSPPEQNKLEIEKYNDYHSSIFPNVEEYDRQDYLWFIVEKLTPLKGNMEVVPKLFPKLANLIGKSTSTSITSVFASVIDILNYYNNIYIRGRKDKTDLLTTVMGYILPKPRYDSFIPSKGKIAQKDAKIHKEAVEKFYEYLRKPDKNMVALIEAIKMGVSGADLHEGNLAFDDEGNIKIIDAGWVDQKIEPSSNSPTYNPHKITENFKAYLNEDIYSDDTRKFIRFSAKTEKYDVPIKRLRALYSYIDAEAWDNLGCGAYRCVFKSPGGEIIKIARPDQFKYGIEMNQKEIDKFNMQNVEAFPRVEEVDKDSLWFVVDEINVLTPKTWDVMKDLFPKLSKILGDLGNDPRFMMNILRLMMDYRDPQGPKKSPESFIRNIQQELFLSAKEIDKNKFRKLYESLFEYMNVGDPNWKRLRYAISKLNTRAYDLSFGNLGFSDDGIIKIIDAGM